jgi:enoyl-[acyl-carrier protein] reductase I
MAARPPWSWGVANDKSIAWGIAGQLAAQGASVIITYQGESLAGG